jgi:hypothetical protein
MVIAMGPLDALVPADEALPRRVALAVTSGAINAPRARWQPQPSHRLLHLNLSETVA